MLLLWKSLGDKIKARPVGRAFYYAQNKGKKRGTVILGNIGHFHKNPTISLFALIIALQQFFLVVILLA